MNFDNQHVIIPDCSFYQDNDSTPNKIDFRQMRAAGAVGVILRAGQNTWADEDFRDYWAEAKEAGLPRGSYWFYDSRAEPGRQATLWKAQIDNDLPELGVWADLEESYNGTWKGERNWKTFMEATKIMFPRVLVGIYTATWWWRAQIVTDPAYFSQYPLWVAQYVSTHLYVILPKPWENKEAKFWQFTASGDGAKYGVESKEIDLNVWNGDLQSFRNYFKLAESPPTEPEPPTGGTMKGTVLSGFAINIRRVDNSEILGTLRGGDVVYGDVTNNRIYYSKIYRANGTIETPGTPCSSAVSGNSVTWIRVEPGTEPPTNPPPDQTPFSLSVQGYKPFNGELEKI